MSLTAAFLGGPLDGVRSDVFNPRLPQQTLLADEPAPVAAGGAIYADPVPA